MSLLAKGGCGGRGETAREKPLGRPAPAPLHSQDPLERAPHSRGSTTQAQLSTLRPDARLRHALASEFPGVTQVVISQRISAIRHADLILVLDAGRVVGQGTHEELRRTCDVYEEICASQLEGEEVCHG